MRSKKFFLSMFIMFCYCVLIVFLPNFSLYVEFRGYILPFLLSVILTMVNFKTIKGWFDYFANSNNHIFIASYICIFKSDFEEKK